MGPWNIFLFIATHLSLFILLNGCNSSNATTFEEKKERVRTVKVVEIQKESSHITHRFPAIIKPCKEVKVSFRIGGPVSSFGLETGEKIKKGETIARIDQRDYLIKIKAARAKLNAARARLKDAELQFKRYKSLLEENAAPKAKFDQVEAGYLSAKSNTRALEKELEAAKNSLNDTSLKAPFTGYVNNIFFEKHETIAPGQPIISLIDISELEIETFIPEKLVSKYKDFKDFSFYLTPFPDLSFGAELKEIGQKATGAGQTYPLILKITNPKGFIKPGMSAVAEFKTEEKNSRSFFDIPISALLGKEPGYSMVWKIEGDKAKKEDVKIIRIINKRKARIAGNLKKGDLIITAGAGFIKENQLVKIVDSGSPTNIGNEL